MKTFISKPSNKCLVDPITYVCIVCWIVLILSGASLCVLSLAEHTWDFKSNYAVVFLGGMGPGTRGFMQTRQSKLLLCMCLVMRVP